MTSFRRPTTAPSSSQGCPTTAPTSSYGRTTTAPTSSYGRTTTAPTSSFGRPTTAPSSNLGRPTTAPTSHLGRPTTAPTSTLGRPTTAPTSTLGRPGTAPTSTLGRPTTSLSSWGRSTASSSSRGRPTTAPSPSDRNLDTPPLERPLTADQRQRLMKSTRKLAKVLGTTPVLRLTPPSPTSTTFNPPQSRNRTRTRIRSSDRPSTAPTISSHAEVEEEIVYTNIAPKFFPPRMVAEKRPKQTPPAARKVEATHSNRSSIREQKPDNDQLARSNKRASPLFFAASAFVMPSPTASTPASPPARMGLKGSGHRSQKSVDGEVEGKERREAKGKGKERSSSESGSLNDFMFDERGRTASTSAYPQSQSAIPERHRHKKSSASESFLPPLPSILEPPFTIETSFPIEPPSSSTSHHASRPNLSVNVEKAQSLGQTHFNVCLATPSSEKSPSSPHLSPNSARPSQPSPTPSPRPTPSISNSPSRKHRNRSGTPSLTPSPSNSFLLLSPSLSPRSPAFTVRTSRASMRRASISSTSPSTQSAFSDREKKRKQKDLQARRKRMSKLARHLGERPPVELVMQGAERKAAIGGVSDGDGGKWNTRKNNVLSIVPPLPPGIESRTMGITMTSTTQTLVDDDRGRVKEREVRQENTEVIDISGVPCLHAVRGYPLPIPEPSPALSQALASPQAPSPADLRLHMPRSPPISRRLPGSYSPQHQTRPQPTPEERSASPTSPMTPWSVRCARTQSLVHTPLRRNFDPRGPIHSQHVDRPFANIGPVWDPAAAWSGVGNRDDEALARWIQEEQVRENEVEEDMKHELVDGGWIRGQEHGKAQGFAVDVGLKRNEGVKNRVKALSRKEKRQGWSGEWNAESMQEVIVKLRGLK